MWTSQKNYDMHQHNGRLKSNKLSKASTVDSIEKLVEDEFPRFLVQQPFKCIKRQPWYTYSSDALLNVDLNDESGQLLLAFCAKLEISFRGFRNDPTNVSVSLLLLVSTNECITKGSLGVKVCYYIGFKYQMVCSMFWFWSCCAFSKCCFSCFDS